MDPYLGEVRAFAGNYTPEDWVICNGALLSISTYQALFAVLGTMYGGDGVSTFGVPNLSGRLVVGNGQLTGGANYPLGSNGGQSVVQLEASNIPSHSHAFNVSSTPGTLSQASGNVLAGFVDVANPSYPVHAYQGPSATSTPSSVQWADNAVSNTNTFNIQHNNMQPFLCITYIMCAVGLFPQPQ
jgi:microcystin-dependent protein